MADISLFGRLKRLFSNNVVVRQVSGKKLKVADTDNIQATISNAMWGRYSRVHAASANTYGLGSYGSNMAYQTQRLMLFRDYDLMDTDPIISTAVDIYADECTVSNEYGEILTISADNVQVKDILHNLFYDILNIEFTLVQWIRNLCKYGDFFLFLEISPEYGVHNVMPLSVYDTIRKEGEDPNNPYFVYFETLGNHGQKQKFDNYEIAHFRLCSDSNFIPYGKSMIENARRIFRQLMLMEDAMMIHRIMRAPEKRIFKIDVGNIPPAQIDTYIQQVMDKSKKVPFVDPTTGDYNLRYNMQNIMEDFYLPVRGSDSGTHIENLGGLEYNAIDDIEYLRNKLMAALKIPKSFLGYDESVNGKATLAAEDVRFSRTIERIQRIVISELTKIAIVHLYAQGFRDSDLVNFKLELTNPSTVSESEKLAKWEQQAQLTLSLQALNLHSSDWVYKNVWKMSDSDITKSRANLIVDKKFQFRLSQIEQGMSDPAKFGFPQDQPQEMNPNAMEGGPGGEGGGSTGGGAPTGGVSSIEQLPTASELGLEEESVETRGRPRTGIQYGQDDHVRGRDPLGFKSRFNAMKVSPLRRDEPKPPLTLEMMEKLNVLNSRTGKKTLTESAQPKEDSGTFLDENNILENE
jgi:hypothetical protein